MPAYWLSLSGVPDSPVGIGVTAASEQAAIQMLDDFEIVWHKSLSPICFKTISSLAEVEAPAIRSAIKHHPIEQDGIWFPVFDPETIMQGCVALTTELRHSNQFDSLRQQLASRNINPNEVILYSVDAGNEADETAYRICFPPGNSATIFARWDAKKRSPLWIREIEIAPTDSETWAPEEVVLRKMCTGEFRARFEALVESHQHIQQDNVSDSINVRPTIDNQNEDS